jgi:hypothetical protein
MRRGTVRKEVIVCFEGASTAIMAEQALVDAGITVRVMPAPARIQTGCGFCLRFAPEDAHSAAVFLTRRGFTGMTAYTRDETDGKPAYSPGFPKI